MNNKITHIGTFRDSSKHPIRFDRLHPNSTFKIVDERSRPGTRRNSDDRLYRKAPDGFFSTRLSDGAACVLMPEDLVMPMVPAKGGR